MKRLLFSLPLLIAVAAPLYAQDTIRLKVEMYRNGSEVGAPTVSVVENQTGSVKSGSVTVVVSPTRLDAQRVSLNLAVTSSTKTMKPRIVLKDQAAGSIQWTDGDSFELRITALR
jgi:hypothetical protein